MAGYWSSRCLVPHYNSICALAKAVKMETHPMPVLSSFSSHPKSACFSFSLQNLWASFFFLFVFLSEITVVTFRGVVLLTAYSTIQEVETFYNI